MDNVNKIAYQKPTVQDLGEVTPAHGGACIPGNTAPGGPCQNGLNATGGTCSVGTTRLVVDLRYAP